MGRLVQYFPSESEQAAGFVEPVQAEVLEETTTTAVIRLSVKDEPRKVKKSKDGNSGTITVTSLDETETEA